MRHQEAVTREPVAAVLAGLCEELTSQHSAVGCVVSRVIGDVLIVVAEHATDRATFNFGRGYLVSDFPETARVLETGQPRAVCRLDADADPAEAQVLDDQRLTSVLMLALGVHGEPWGLVEVYGERRFTEDDAQAAEGAVAAAAERMESCLREPRAPEPREQSRAEAEERAGAERR